MDRQLALILSSLLSGAAVLSIAEGGCSGETASWITSTTIASCSGTVNCGVVSCSTATTTSSTSATCSTGGTTTTQTTSATSTIVPTSSTTT